MHAYSQHPQVKVSQQLLLAARMHQPAEDLLKTLETGTVDSLAESLQTDAQRLAFWINIYNAVTQLTLQAHPEYFQDRGSFYARKLIRIAGEQLSLDEIEHGILRRNTSKYSLGYFRKWKTRRCIRKWMVRRIDPRIHYALNCGATSCPAIAFYDDTRLEEQLNLSCSVYLKANCTLKDGKIHVPALFSWFRGDFGNKKGIYRFLERYEILKPGDRPGIAFSDYNWNLMLDQYTGNPSP